MLEKRRVSVLKPYVSGVCSSMTVSDMFYYGRKCQLLFFSLYCHGHTNNFILDFSQAKTSQKNN